MKRWKRDWTLMSVFFDGNEISSITNKLKNLKISTVVFCSFENRFAKAGGLTSVITNILPYIKDTTRFTDVILISPFYPKLMKTKSLSKTGIRFPVPYGPHIVRAELYEYTCRFSTPSSGAIKEYFLKAPSFFNSGSKLNNPYVYVEGDSAGNSEAMNENSLFFCKAVPYALNALGIRKDIVLHLHEWQTALISLTAKKAMISGILESCGTVQTIHNSFDSAIPWKLLAKIEGRTKKLKLAGFTGDTLTAYQIGLQLVDSPVTTVSQNFARELTSDVIQAQYYAPHLQHILIKNRVIGIDNGMFSGFSPEFPKQEKHSVDEIRKIKLRNRKSMLKLLRTYNPGNRFGELTYKSGSITKLPDTVPIFVMSGRLDPVQKGYDILLRVIEGFAEDEAKFILTPMPAALSDLDYFYEVACKCRGNVTVFPMRMDLGYQELQTGCTFGIMPSIYEPFGAAVEYMANGTVNIGRATGGLVNQIDKKCGFLYKEDSRFYSLDYIESFIRSGTIVQTRKTNAFAQSMTASLSEVMKHAARLYQKKPERYYQMIIQGFRQARKFNWKTSAEQYYNVYKMISRA